MIINKTYQKQAILVLLHDNFDFFEKNSLLLDSCYFDIFVHLDLKSDINELTKRISALQCSNVYFVEDRVNVRWGDYSIVEAEYRLMKLASDTNSYLYYHLISGADFILKTPKQLFDFFSEHQPVEFINLFEYQGKEDFYHNRYKYRYHIRYPKKKNTFTKGLYQLYITCNQYIQRLFFRDKKPPYNLKLGSQWFSLTHDSIKFVLDNESDIISFYDKTLVPDESFLQSLLYSNNRIKARIVQPNNDYASIKRHIEFINGKPKVWTIGDKDLLDSSEAFFVRKVQEGASDELVNYLFNKIMKEKEDGL